MEYQVELRNVVKEFKGFRAVDDVSIQISKGEIVSLLGSSGCGKTTTLRMVAGLLLLTEGSVAIAGQDVTNLPPYKRDVSMVFQSYALFPHMTVLENVMFGLKYRKVYRDAASIRKKAEEMIGVVQLTGQESKFPRQLSGGQQQRVSLARALAVKPKVMLFDEPLSNLDAKLRVQTRAEIRRILKQMDITALYVTHDQEEALTISDRIAVMHQGKLQQISTPLELYYKPKTAFVANFIGQANMFAGSVIQNNGLKFKTNGGLVFSAGTPDVEITDSMSLIVRPEAIAISRDKPDTDNVLEAIVLEKQFLGFIVRYLVGLSDSSNMVIQTNPDQNFELNERVYVSFSKEKTVLVN